MVLIGSLMLIYPGEVQQKNNQKKHIQNNMSFSFLTLV